MVRKIGLALAAVSSLLSCCAISVAALNYGSGTYGACQYETCGITLSTSGTVADNVTPTTSTACTIQSDTVSVFTDDSSGFTLSMSNSSTNTSLLNGGNSIPAIGGSLASPIALTANTWGFRIDGVGGFGAGPTTAHTNTALSSATFTGVPSSSSPVTVLSTSTAADPAVNTLVWYGVCANTSVPSGTYSTGVTYTAVTN